MQLAEVLSRLGIEGLIEPDAWRRIAIVRNFAPVPHNGQTPEWGFKALVLDRFGKPQWYARCSWASNVDMRREALLLDTLCNSAQSRDHVPETRTIFEQNIVVQISRIVSEQNYQAMLSNRPAVEWTRDVREIIAMSEKVMSVVSQNSELFGFDLVAKRREQLFHDIEAITKAGVRHDILGALQDTLAALVDAQPVVLQHGDLWPPNVLRAKDGWALIDFSECGTVWMPGFDLFHMISNGPPGFSTSWIGGDGKSSGEVWETARQQLLAEYAERFTLSASALGGCALAYLVRIAAHRLRPGVAREYSEYWINELDRVCSRILGGKKLDELVVHQVSSSR
jgi:hypothetical protein